MQANNLLRTLFEYKSWANDELFASVATLDEHAHADERHMAIRLLNHIYVVDRIFLANMQCQRHGYQGVNTPDTPSLTALRENVAQTDRWLIDYAGKLAPDALDEAIDFTFTDGTAGRMTRGEMLMHVITHGGYHRGAIGRILAQLKLTPPRDTLTVFLQRQASASQG